jgi:hypothetical protein
MLDIYREELRDVLPCNKLSPNIFKSDKNVIDPNIVVSPLISKLELIVVAPRKLAFPLT